MMPIYLLPFAERRRVRAGAPTALLHSGQPESDRQEESSGYNEGFGEIGG